MSARRAPNRCSWCCWRQLANCRRSSSYACRVRPLYPARNPAKASRSVLVNTGVTEPERRTELWWPSGTSRTRAQAPKLGQPRPQQTMRTRGKTADLASAQDLRSAPGSQAEAASRPGAGGLGPRWSSPDRHATHIFAAYVAKFAGPRPKAVAAFLRACALLPDAVRKAVTE